MTTPRLLVAALLLACSAPLAGCGGGDEADPAGSDASSSSDEQAFRDCLADQGVELPEAGASPDLAELDPAALQEAMAACGDLAPEGLPGGAAGTPDPTALKAFQQCLRKRDVRVKADLASIQELDRSDPKVVEALDACAGLIGQ